MPIILNILRGSKTRKALANLQGKLALNAAERGAAIEWQRANNEARAARNEEARAAVRRHNMEANIAEARRLRNETARAKAISRVTGIYNHAAVLARPPTGSKNTRRTMGRGTPRRPTANSGRVSNVKGNSRHITREGNNMPGNRNATIEELAAALDDLP